MTKVYFVRHAEPEHSWADDRTRPLTKEGIKDCDIVLNFFQTRKIDKFYSSPYKRSVDTIQSSADYFHCKIITDERFREREKGVGSNNYGMYQKRWNNHDFHEKNGESINMVQKRNVEALFEILLRDKDKTVVIGTHGTALSTLLNYFNSDFGFYDFMHIIDWMPYIVELNFDDNHLISVTEHCYKKKVFSGNKRADIMNV